MSYNRFLKKGGDQVWTALLAEAGFKSPFETGALKEFAEQIEVLLNRLRQ